MKRLVTAAACLFALAACEFDRVDQNPTPKINSCSVDVDCSGSESCAGGLCVASSDAELEIALQITPLPTKDSETPHPVLIEGLKVKSGTLAQRIDLRTPVDVVGSVRSHNAAIDASLSFTPVHTLTGIPAATVSASTTRANMAGDYEVELSAGVEYTMLVRPADTSIPPWRTTFTVTSREGPSVEFADLETRTQTYLVKAPDDRALLMQAFDGAGRPLSSTAAIEAGIATLVFATDPEPYRLEIRAKQTYEPTKDSMAEGIFCDDDTPVSPIYSIDESDLGAKDADGAIELKLPVTPARIRYQGTIALCGTGTDAENKKIVPFVTELPVYLRSSNILPDDDAFSASFDVHTTAQRDPGDTTREFTFCVQLMEGDYDVVVTPPTSLPCAVFAQHLTIDAPPAQAGSPAPDGMAARGMMLTLPAATSLRGTLQTLDEMPLAGATVDAVALGRVIDLDDPTVTTRYNRSRQVITAERGTFVVPVDLGAYDLLVKPPATSGFSWQVRHDVVVGGENEDFADRFEVASPVMLSGRLGYATGGADLQAKLAGAEVLAYAVINQELGNAGDVAVVSQRAIPIGKATADADGTFMLLLPQAITSEW